MIFIQLVTYGISQQTLDFCNKSMELHDVRDLDIFEFHVAVFEDDAQRSNFILVHGKSLVVRLLEEGK